MPLPTVQAAFVCGTALGAASAALAAVVSLVHLCACFSEKTKLRMATKPLLMPAAILLHAAICGLAHPLVIAALVFGCMGDIFLMFVRRNRSFLVCGLLSFLIGHGLYIAAAVKTGLPGRALGAAGALPLVITAACALVCGACAYAFLYKSIYAKLKAAAAVYILGLTAMAATMVYCCIGSFGPATGLMACGGLLFVVSDFILACKLFGVIKRKRLNFAVMLTYIAAQQCLAVGFALV